MTTITLNHDAELPITREDCLDYLNDDQHTLFFQYASNGMRIGQAWFNCLSADDANKLTGTLYDPFYRDDWLSVRQALMFLLEN